VSLEELYGKETVDALNDFLVHAADAAQLLEERAATNPHVADLACEALMVRIGESANRAGHEFSNAHPELRFRDIIGARNVAAHGYDIVDHKIYWDAFANRLPGIAARVRAILDEN